MWWVCSNLAELTAAPHSYCMDLGRASRCYTAATPHLCGTISAGCILWRSIVALLCGVLVVTSVRALSQFAPLSCLVSYGTIYERGVERRGVDYAYLSTAGCTKAHPFFPAVHIVALVVNIISTIPRGAHHYPVHSKAGYHCRYFAHGLWCNAKNSPLFRTYVVIRFCSHLSTDQHGGEETISEGRSVVCQASTAVLL